MNPVAERVERLVAAGDSLEALQHTFQYLIGELGLSHFLYMERPHPIPPLQPGIEPSYLGRDAAALACYVESISRIGDPVGNELLRRVAPFTIEEAMRTH
ncbi:MAG: hypothetical protein RBU25_20775, partial [Lentisphaeria bacterium]|nr:hypothetical protein [Lentisphaeria bacterium]